MKKKGKLLIELKRYEEALPIWQKTARLDLKDASLQNNIGNILSELGRYEEAIEAYNRAIRLDRSSVHAYRSKASVLEKLRKVEFHIHNDGQSRLLKSTIGVTVCPLTFEPAHSFPLLHCRSEWMAPVCCLS